MRIITIINITGITIGVLILLLLGVWIILSLDSVFHDTKKAVRLDINSNQKMNRVIYIGHSTVLIQLDGLNIITDPIFSKRILGFSKRYVEPGITFKDLPKIDAIIISHGHFDHFDKPSLKKFNKNIQIIVPKGLKNKIAKLGFQNIQELEWWENMEISSVKITATPIKHLMSRSASYIIQGSKTVYFVGDSGPNDYFEEIGKKFNIDLALLPMGSYRPHLWFIPGMSAGMRKTHMMPTDIPLVQKQLKAKIIIPIHWGVFKITAEPAEEPKEKMQKIINQQKLKSKIEILESGEMFNL